MEKQAQATMGGHPVMKTAKAKGPCWFAWKERNGAIYQAHFESEEIAAQYGDFEFIPCGSEIIYQTQTNNGEKL